MIRAFGQEYKRYAISKPLVRVFRLVDGEKLTMGYLYEAMDRAKGATMKKRGMRSFRNNLYEK